MSVIVLLRWTIILFATCLAQRALAGDYLEQLKSICANNKQVGPSRATELSALVDAAASLPNDGQGCSSWTLLALVELDQLINSGVANVCLSANINQIRAYYFKFVDKKSLAGQQALKLPKALKRLYLSYGFSISRLCKATMINSLILDSKSLLNEHDFSLVSNWTSDHGSLAKLMRRPNDVDDIVLPKDIISLLTKKNKCNKGVLQPGVSGDSDHSRVFVALQPATSRTLKRVQAVCERRFRPIYEQLILPLVSLSRIGLNYKIRKLDGHMGQMSNNKSLRLWYRIVYLCESVANLGILDDPENIKAAQDGRLVRILTEQEIEELKRTQPIASESDVATDIGEMINYEVGAELKLGDLIFDKDDKSLRKLVDRFEANKSEMARMRAKVIRHMMAYTKEFFKNSKVNVVRLLKKGSFSSMNNELVRIIDEHVSNISSETDEPDVSSATKPSKSNGHIRVKRASKGLVEVIAFFLALFLAGIIIVSLAKG